MNTLRHDLKTTGWSMFPVPTWPERLRRYMREWDVQYFNSDIPNSGILLEFANEMSWFLHEALHDEYFDLMYVESREHDHLLANHWHTDGGYLRVLLTCEGEGTLAALGFENNIMTPPGHALVLTGDHRAFITGMPMTWHAAPDLGSGRRLVTVNYFDNHYVAKFKT